LAEEAEAIICLGKYKELVGKRPESSRGIKRLFREGRGGGKREKGRKKKKRKEKKRGKATGRKKNDATKFIRRKAIREKTNYNPQVGIVVQETKGREGREGWKKKGRGRVKGGGRGGR